MKTVDLIPAEFAWVFVDSILDGEDANWIFIKKGWAVYKRTGDVKFFENRYLSRIYWKVARFCFCLDQRKNIIGYNEAKEAIVLDGRNEPWNIQEHHIRTIKNNGWKLFVHSEQVHGRYVIQLHQN